MRWSLLSHLHPLTSLHHLSLIGLSYLASDAEQLTSFLAAGSCSTLRHLVLGNGLRLSLMGDEALAGFSSLECEELEVMDLSGCMEITAAGKAREEGKKTKQMDSRE